MKNIGALRNPTWRKILNRGWIPVAYHPPGEPKRYGWVVRTLRSGAVHARFPGDEAARRIAPPNLRHLRRLDSRRCVVGETWDVERPRAGGGRTSTGRSRGR